MSKKIYNIKESFFFLIFHCNNGLIGKRSSAIMRWYTNNTSVSEDKYGNKMFGKIEPKLRKNDGFMAFDVAMFCKDELEVQIIYI